MTAAMIVGFCGAAVALGGSIWMLVYAITS